MNLLDRSDHQFVCLDPPTDETSRWNFASKKYDIRLHRQASLLRPHRSRLTPESFGRTSRLLELCHSNSFILYPCSTQQLRSSNLCTPVLTRQDIYAPVSGKIVSICVKGNTCDNNQPIRFSLQACLQLLIYYFSALAPRHRYQS